MSDRLKLSDAKGEAEVARVAVAQELMEDHKRIKELEENIAALEAELAKQKRNVPATAAPKKNKIGARKQASFMAISTAPSINKTPIGPSMVPVPYPTVQDLTNSTSTAKTVNFNGCPAYLLDCSSQPSCKGDAPGTGKGVRSGTVSGEVKPIQGTRTVRIEGKRIVREGDACTMNGGNNLGVYVTKTSPSGGSPKQAAFNSNPTSTPQQPSRLSNWLMESVADFQEAFDKPWEGIKGAAKGIANIPSHVLELLLKGGAEQQALEMIEAAALQTLLGNDALANRLSDLSGAAKRSGSLVDLPKFHMTNAAQRGGDTIATIVQVAYGGVGLTKGIVRGLVPASEVGSGTARKAIGGIASPGSKSIGPSTTRPSSNPPPTGDGLKVIGKAKGTTPASTYKKIVDQVSGKILDEADALNPGALGDELKGLAETFSGGRYATIELDRPLIAYRAWTPGQSNEFGAFWTLEKPQGSLQSRIDSALLPEWGKVRGTAFNAQATHYSVIEIPAGTKIHIGEIGSQGGMWVGGKSQLLIDGGTKPAWKNGGGTLK